MIKHQIDAFLQQETWIKVNAINKARDCTMLVHRLDKHATSRWERGVVIILSLMWFSHYEKSGGFLLSTTSRDDEVTNGGRLMEIKLQLNPPFKNKNGDFTKWKKPNTKVINLKLMPTHISDKFEHQQCLQEFVVDKMQNSKCAAVIGQDSNAQIRKCNETHDDGELKADFMVRSGIERRDAKEE